MEFASIEREIRIDAAPDVVFEVVTSPEHIKDWWTAETDIVPMAGSNGELVFSDSATVAITVVDARPPRLFSFRWTQPTGAAATEGNSLLVTFTLTPDGDGTVLHMTETGFRAQGWEAAVLEQTYNDHVRGWDDILPKIAATAARMLLR